MSHRQAPAGVLLRVALIATLAIASLAACGDDDDGGSPTPIDDVDASPVAPPTTDSATFEKHSYPLPGVAFLLPLAGDASGHRLLASSLARELDLSQIPVRAPFSPGALYDLRRQAGDPAGQWSHELVFDKDAGIRWPNQPGMFDIDNDGADEIIVPWGFLSAKEGGLAYVELAADGSYGAPQAFIERSACAQTTDVECGWYFHEIAVADFNADGERDFATTARWGGLGASGGNALMWFENTGGAGEVSYRRHDIAAAGGTLIDTHDIDGDGDLDLVLPQYFGGASLVWFERQGDGQDVRWVEHVIDDTTGRGFQIELADVDKDGRTDIVYANHNHQDHPDADKRVMGVYWWSIPANPASLDDWNATKHVVYEGFHVAKPAFSSPNPNAESAPGHFTVADLHGDGWLDIVISGDGDPGLYILEQRPGGSFEITNLDPGAAHANSGAAWVTDLNGDGKVDIVWAVFESQPSDSALLSFIQN